MTTAIQSGSRRSVFVHRHRVNPKEGALLSGLQFYVQHAQHVAHC